VGRRRLIGGSKKSGDRWTKKEGQEGVNYIYCFKGAGNQKSKLRDARRYNSLIKDQIRGGGVGWWGGGGVGWGGGEKK